MHDHRPPGPDSTATAAGRAPSVQLWWQAPLLPGPRSGRTWTRLTAPATAAGSPAGTGVAA